MPRPAAEFLPADLLSRASLQGNEYAWPVGDVPAVIAAAREANLVSLGGQLQFRLPSGGTCECYWVQVETYSSVETTLAWPERVKRTASAGARDFAELRHKFDFMEEGRKDFAQYLDKEIAAGRNPLDSMYFVWDLLTEEEAKTQGW